MKLLDLIADGLISAFGITRPRPEQRRVANLLIGGLLLAVIVAVFGTVGLLLYLTSGR